MRRHRPHIPKAPRGPKRQQERTSLRKNYKDSARVVETLRALGQKPSQEQRDQLRAARKALRSRGYDIPEMRKFWNKELPGLFDYLSGLNAQKVPAGGGVPAGNDYAVGPMPSGSVSLPAIPNYPSTPSPLTAAQIAELDAAKNNAETDYKMALVNREKALQELDSNFIVNSGKIARNFYNQRMDLGSELGVRGVAFDPRMAGRGIRQLRDENADLLGQARESRTRGIADLNQMISGAELARTRTIADIERQRAALTGNYQNYLTGVNY